MLVISSREFRQKQSSYFDLADKNNQIVVQRGKNKGYLIYPLSEFDRISYNPDFIKKIKLSEQQIREGKTKRLTTKNELSEFLDS